MPNKGFPLLNLLKIGTSLSFSTETLSYIWNLKIKKKRNSVLFLMMWFTMQFFKKCNKQLFLVFKNIFTLRNDFKSKNNSLESPKNFKILNTGKKNYDMVIIMAELFAKIFYFWNNKFKKFWNFYQILWKMKPKSSSMWLFLWHFLKDLCKT